MSRFRFSALLAISVAVAAVIVLRRDKRRAEFAVPVPAAPATPVATAIPEVPPVEEPPVEEPPVEEPSVEEPSVEQAPVAQTPVEEAPVAYTPVEEAPVAYTPVEEAPVADTPVEEAPVAHTPVEEAPVAHTPIEEPAPRVEIPLTPVQLHPETDGVSGADPVPGYWGVPPVPPAPPADWSDSPSFGDRRSA